MPVTFGTSTTVTGAGAWTYPDVGLVIGLLVDVDSVAQLATTFGTEIIRYHGAGVFAPISEAGRLHAFPLYNDQLVTYDIGHGPVGVAYDLPTGTEVTFTEILSETPPTGGGGGTDVQAAVVYDTDTGQNIVGSTWTTLAATGLKAETNSAVLEATPDGCATVHQDGVYLASAIAVAPGASLTMDARLQLQDNGTGFDTQDISYNVAGIDPTVNLTYVHNFVAGDVLRFQLIHDASSTTQWFFVLSYALLAPST